MNIGGSYGVDREWPIFPNISTNSQYVNFIITNTTKNVFIKKLEIYHISLYLNICRNKLILMNFFLNTFDTKQFAYFVNKQLSTLIFMQLKQQLKINSMIIMK